MARRTAWAAAIATVGVAATAGAAAREPAPLSGVPLPRETGLRLVVADIPPFILDVDTGRAMRIARLPGVRRGVLWVVGVGGRGAVVVADSAPEARLYALDGTRTTALGTGQAVVPAADGKSVWVKRAVGRDRCTLRQVGLDGRPRSAPRAFPCATTIASGGSLGLVVNRTRVLDPRTGRTVQTTRWGVLAAAGRRLVLAGPGRRFTVLDTTTGAERRLRWPSILTGLGHGPAVDPQGRFVALEFADPAWNGGPGQALDVWLLDTATGALTQLPAMPALVSLKFTSLAWTDDGRLVLLGEHDDSGVIAVWRPGDRRLGVKAVRLPQRRSGSDSFAPLGYDGRHSSSVGSRP